MTTYSIYKDEETQNTVKRIKKILETNGIEVEEEITSKDELKRELCPSIKINIANTKIGTNGKGTCLENALASGYGEFMERLQNSYLVNFKFPDKKQIDIRNINKNILCNTEIDIKQKIISALPFYSVKDKEVINIPLYLFESTNGLAAGNTYEEALVQGLSEICERYALKNILLNRITLPDIPENLYIQYDNIKNIINYYNQKGYKIFVKDASIGKNLPVVCTAAINEKENILTFCLGSHPVLPVAIERTLTEIFQGQEAIENESKYMLNNYFNKYLKNNRLALFELLVMNTIRFEDNEDLTKQFILNTPSFEFNNNAWINSSEKVSNKDLLKFLITNIKPITKNEIYIRDVSFLEFPAISIFIPAMSKFIPAGAAQVYAITKWSNYEGQNDNYYDNIMNLQNLAEFLYEHPLLSSAITDKIPIEYILVLCSIVLKDYNKVIKYADILLNKWAVKRENTIKLIKDYYTLKQNGFSDSEINNSLNKCYPASDIEFFYRFINKLSFKTIKQILLSYINQKKEDTAVLNKIKENLQTAYKQNIPDQMKLKEIFDFI